MPPDSLSPRILITRLSAVGDCIHTLPLLCALREHFPNALLAWLVQPVAAPLLDGHPCLDRLITVSKGYIQSPSQLRGLRHRLRQMRFDVVIDPQSLTKSAVAGWLSGAKQRIGFAKPQGREMSLWLNNQLVSPQKDHVIDRYLELLRPLGISRPSVQYALRIDPVARQTADLVIQKSGMQPGFALINPGAGWPSKVWPAERYGMVAGYLGQVRQLRSLVVWAGDQELEWARQIVELAHGHAVLAPPTSLTELAALTQAARLMVGSDTGPLHLAAALETPCVCLLGPTQPRHCGPYGLGHVAIQEQLQQGTGRQRRGVDNSAMQAIAVDTVYRACDEILDRPSHPLHYRCSA